MIHDGDSYDEMLLREEVERLRALIENCHERVLECFVGFNEAGSTDEAINAFDEMHDAVKRMYQEATR